MASICYDNELRGMTLTAEDTETDNPAANAIDGRTSTQMACAAGVRNIDYDNGSAITIDSFCMARHNLGSISASIKIFAGNVVDTWTFLKLFNPIDDEIFVQEFDTTVSYRYWRIQISGGSDTAYVGDWHIGTRLDLQRDQKGGFVRPEYQDNDEIITARSRGNNLVGITIRPKPKRFKFELFYYDSTFMASWVALRDTMKQYPIYLLWRDNETAVYAWPQKNLPNPTYATGIKDYWNVTLNLEGIIE